MNETNLLLIAFWVFLAIVAIIFVLKTLREKRDKVAEAEKSAEVDHLLKEILDFDLLYDHSIELRLAQEDTLQKIQAICDPIGVQVEVKSQSSTLQLTSSIDNIKSLRFLNESLPLIEELCKIYKENDPMEYMKPTLIKYNNLYDMLMVTYSTERWNSLGEDKKAKVQYYVDMYYKVSDSSDSLKGVIR